MAASATATAYISTSFLSSSTSSRTHQSKTSVPSSVCFTFTTSRRRAFVTCNSSDDASAETTTAEPETDASIEVPKGPPSLISALNVEKALRGIAITDADHYGRLGLRRGCSYDQVTVAYTRKVEEAASQGLEQEELDKQLELLRESYSILSSVEERRLYDWSLSRNEKPDRYMWPFEVDITQTPTGTPPPEEPEDEGPTRLVGYFALAWFLLAATLSIAFNR